MVIFVGEPEYVGKFPIRRDIPVLPHPDPNRKVGWYHRSRPIPPDDPLWKDPNFLGGEITEISREPFAE